MKNLWIVGIVIAWMIISVVGMLSWECRTDMYQGIVLSLGITAMIYGFSKFAGKSNEYNEYGEYRQKY